MRNEHGALIGVYGGTFDPVHFGHLRPALELMEELELREVRFVPAACPPHRSAPVVSAAGRLAMLREAIRSQPGFVLDDREMRRDGPSYTAETLGSFREEFPDTRICLVMGLDAFLGLLSWHRWQRVLELAHLVVSHRPGQRPPSDGPLAGVLAERRVFHARELHEHATGRILLKSVTQLDISATELRKRLAEGRSVRYLLPETVRRYIETQRLYRPHRSES